MDKIERKIRALDKDYYDTNKNLIDDKWKEIAKIQECNTNYQRCKEDIEFFKELVQLAPNLLAIIYEYMQVNDINELLRKSNIDNSILLTVIDVDIYSWSFFTSLNESDFIYKSMEYIIGKSELEYCIDYYSKYKSSAECSLNCDYPSEDVIDRYVDKYVDVLDSVIKQESDVLSSKLAWKNPLIRSRFDNKYSIDEYVQYINLGGWMLSLFILPGYMDEEHKKILKRNNKKAKMEMTLDKDR